MRLWHCLILSLLALTSAFATPEPPTSLTICAVGDSVLLRWAPSQGAAGYRVYFAETFGGPVSLLCETTGTTAVDTLGQGKRFYYVSAFVPNVPPVFAPLPDQALVEDSLQASPVNLRAYITDESPFDELSFLIIQPAKLTLGLDDSLLYVASLAPDSNGLDSALIRVTDPEGGTAEQTIRYAISERTDLRLFVWDFDRQAVNNAKVRIISGSDSAAHTTTDAHLHIQLAPADSVVARAWRSTSSAWNDTLSSYIRTKKLPALADRFDTLQVQTWDVCDSMDVSPTDYKAFINEARGGGMIIGGQIVRVLGGINPETINQDTLWIGRVNPTNSDTSAGDTLLDWEQDSIQNTFEELRLRMLFPDSPYPTYYQSDYGEPEPFVPFYGPARLHLHLWYKNAANCDIGLYRDFANDASTTRALTHTWPTIHPLCLRQELGTNVACTNGAPFWPAMANRTVLHESAPTVDYTYADKELFRVWIQTPPNTRIEWIYGMP